MSLCNSMTFRASKKSQVCNNGQSKNREATILMVHPKPNLMIRRLIIMERMTPSLVEPLNVMLKARLQRGTRLLLR
jgi:hypothetical protein